MAGHRILIWSVSSRPSPVARILVAAGFKVSRSAAHHTPRGLRTRPALAILDFDLTDPAAFARLCDLRPRCTVPIVVLTGDCPEAYVLHALELGADDCLRKPIRPREFIARLRAQLRRSTGDWLQSA